LEHGSRAAGFWEYLQKLSNIYLGSNDFSGHIPESLLTSNHLSVCAQHKRRRHSLTLLIDGSHSSNAASDWDRFWIYHSTASVAPCHRNCLVVCNSLHCTWVCKEDYNQHHQQVNRDTRATLVTNDWRFGTRNGYRQQRFRRSDT
jgi:hypothetical protein